MRLDLYTVIHITYEPKRRMCGIYIHMYVFRRDTFRLKHSVSRVATAMEDDSAAEHSTEQIKTQSEKYRSRDRVNFVTSRYIYLATDRETCA